MKEKPVSGTSAQFHKLSDEQPSNIGSVTMVKVQNWTFLSLHCT